MCLSASLQNLCGLSSLPHCCVCNCRADCRGALTSSSLMMMMMMMMVIIVMMKMVIIMIVMMMMVVTLVMVIQLQECPPLSPFPQ